MTKSNVTKWGGVIGSVILGVVAILKGDVVNGAGIITASLGSAGVFAQR